MGMTDHFQALDLPRRAALREEALAEAYFQKSRESHPDHGGAEEVAAQVNAAYETLRQPEKRLKHLIEIAAPAEAKAWRTVPLDDAMMALFARLGGAIAESGKYLEKRNKAQSALGRALLANEEFQQRDALEKIGEEIQARQAVIEERLPGLDAALQADPVTAQAWRDVATLQAQLAYLAKWQTQVRERLLQLM